MANIKKVKPKKPYVQKGRPSRAKTEANPAKKPAPKVDVKKAMIEETKKAKSGVRAEITKRKYTRKSRCHAPTYWAREQAGLLYITSPDPPSIKKMAEDPQWGVKFATLQTWSIQDEWVKRRNEFFDRIADKVKAQISERLVQGRIEALEVMTGMLETSLTEFGQKDEDGNLKLKARSFEGMVSAIVKLQMFVEDLRDRIAERATPSDLGSATVESDTTTLTPDEAKHVAKALMEKRRDDVRKQLQAGIDNATKTLDKERSR